jgi:tetratricopeptide (TPR) repeat protein
MLGRGATLGRYTIESVLGEGGMGTVYRARDARLRRPVALKVLRANARSPRARQEGHARLLREARAAAALCHDNAVAIYDVGEIGGVAFIAMELVEGRPLRAVVGDERIPMSRRLEIVTDVARALAAAHDRGLVHRDIKPENVMLRIDGAVKVLDFGLAHDASGDALSPLGLARDARRSSSMSAGQTLSHDGVIAGTPRYMAPEQLRGDRQDARTDQFSWAVLAYELLTGRSPWGDDSLTLTLVQRIESEAPPPPRTVSPDVPATVQRVVLRALAKEPHDRFVSMRDAIEALETDPQTHQSLQGAAITQGPRALRRSDRPAPGRPVPTLAAACFAALAIAGAIASGPAGRAADDASAAPPAPAPAPTSLAELPPADTELPEARAAYVAGLHALRDGSVLAATASFARAAELDPSMAAAHVRLVVWDQFSDADNVHAHFARALEQRSRLSERDRAVLWMMEPYYLSPSGHDEKTVSERARELERRWPLDAELVLWAATRERDSALEVAGYERALVIDPGFMLAYMRLAAVHLQLGDIAAAIDAYGRCLAEAPSSSGCLAGRIAAFEEVGRCGEMEADARLLAKTSPSARAHDWVARALYAGGAGEDGVRAALALKWAASRPDAREADRNADEAHLAILRGDFALAERLARANVAAVDGPSEERRAAAILPLEDLLFETGQTAAAGRVANDYLSQRTAWDGAGVWAPVPLLMAVAVHAGLRTEDQRVAARAAWLKEWDEIEGPLHAQAWELGYAMPATTAAEAIEALAAAPEPMPRLYSNQFHREGLEANGRALLLAGRSADALPQLRAAARACMALQAPIEATQASFHLGQALEQTGDPAGACAAYGLVLARWGSAHPRSVTADQARVRARALACP